MSRARASLRRAALLWLVEDQSGNRAESGRIPIGSYGQQELNCWAFAGVEQMQRAAV
jgi:hypothetical protein